MSGDQTLKLGGIPIPDNLIEAFKTLRAKHLSKVQQLENEITMYKAQVEHHRMGQKGLLDKSLQADKKAAVTKAVKQHIWGQVIFITDEKSLTMVTKVLSYEMYIPEIENEKDPEKKEQIRLRWIGMTRDMVDQTHNSQRSYATGEVSKVMVSMMMEADSEDELTGKHVITVKEVELCALRDQTFCETRRGQFCMAFYHDVLLAKIGCTEHWAMNVRTRCTISGATHEKTRAQDPRLRIPADFEAFLCAQFTSSFKRWGMIAAEKATKGAKWTPSPKEEKSHSTFTCPKQGMAGYTVAGRLYFGDMRKKIEEARQKPHVKAIEELALHHVR